MCLPVCVYSITLSPVTDDLCFGSVFSGGQQGYCQTSEKETSFQGNLFFFHLLAMVAHVACGSFFFFWQITVRVWHLLFF